MSRTIAICIATFRRPEMLGRLLESLSVIERPDDATIEIRVVDNDAAGTARDAVERYRATGTAPGEVRYEIEEKANIAHARNHLVEMGPVDIIVFIDDDEVAEPQWLTELVSTCDRTNADAVIGFVGGRVPDSAPRWMARGGFHDHHTGEQDAALDWPETRSGCTLVRGHLYYEKAMRFDAAFGRSGGEDVDFFARCAKIGATFAAAPEAKAWEDVEPDRLSFRWIWMRKFRGGLIFQRLLALHAPNDMHPAVRFAARMARACVGIVVNLPHLLMGKPERVIRPLLGIALACGGLKAWMSPDRASEGAWYGDADASKANVTSAETDTDQDEYKAAA